MLALSGRECDGTLTERMFFNINQGGTAGIIRLSLFYNKDGRFFIEFWKEEERKMNKRKRGAEGISEKIIGKCNEILKVTMRE